MKRLFTILCLVLLTLFAGVTPALADDLAYDASIYRVTDHGDCLDSSEIEYLDELYCEFIELYHIDLPVSVIDGLGESYEDIAEYGNIYYEDNNFGYGDNRDGLLLVIDISDGSFYLQTYGNASTRIPQVSIDALYEKLESMWGDDYTCGDILKFYRDDVIGCLTGDTGVYLNTAGMPDWYPEDIGKFERFHNENAPRVVDTANIFTDEQEKAMQEKISTIQNEYGKDLVVFTDVSSYGLSRAVYAADFHFFGGYGFGDDYTGTILFICMESGNRGWWTAASGECKGLYTEEVVNKIDDQLEPYMVDGASSGNANGEYGKGVLDYLDNVANLYYEPDWYTSGISENRFHNDASVPRVVDNANLFTPEEEAELETRIAELADEYGDDAVILTEPRLIWDDDPAVHAELFYQCNGYGYGDNFRGVILCICPNESGAYRYGVYLEGLNNLGANTDRLMGRLEQTMDTLVPDSFKAADRFLHDADRLFDTGRVPKAYAVFPTICISLIVGALAGLIVVAIEKKKMKTVANAEGAQEYMVPGSFRRSVIGDVLLSVTTTKSARKKDTSSDSSSGGGSSYSSDYSSSGGGDYSGGGRSF